MYAWFDDQGQEVGYFCSFFSPAQEYTNGVVVYTSPSVFVGTPAHEYPNSVVVCTPLFLYKLASFRKSDGQRLFRWNFACLEFGPQSELSSGQNRKIRYKVV